MDKTFILPSYVDDNIRIRLERTPFQKMKECMLDACKVMDGGGIDINPVRKAVTNIPDKVLSEDITAVYAALAPYCEILDRDDPERTKYKPRYNDMAGHLDDLQAALYNMALKVKFQQGYDYVRVYDPMQKMEFKNRLEKLMLDVIGFRDLLHLSLEGIRSDSVGPDEVENGIGSLYFLSEILTKRFVDIQEKFFP